MIPDTLWLWLGFTGFVLAVLALDLGVFNRKAHVVSYREAALWSLIWIGLALAMGVVLYLWRGPDVALQFFTGYVIEKSLSVDNIFIFVLIFSTFAVPAAYQHRVLFWGVIGALVMRGALILGGAALVATFHWVLYLFGAFLTVTGLRMARQRGHAVHPDRHPLIRLARRLVPVAADYAGPRFLVWREGRGWGSPPFLVLLLVGRPGLIF